MNAKITWDFGDDRCRIASARLEKDIFVKTHLHTSPIVVKILFMATRIKLIVVFSLRILKRNLSKVSEKTTINDYCIYITHLCRHCLCHCVTDRRVIYRTGTSVETGRWKMSVTARRKHLWRRSWDVRNGRRWILSNTSQRNTSIPHLPYRWVLWNCLMLKISFLGKICFYTISLFYASRCFLQEVGFHFAKLFLK